MKISHTFMAATAILILFILMPNILAPMQSLFSDSPDMTEAAKKLAELAPFMFLVTILVVALSGGIALAGSLGSSPTKKKKWNRPTQTIAKRPTTKYLNVCAYCHQPLNRRYERCPHCDAPARINKVPA